MSMSVAERNKSSACELVFMQGLTSMVLAAVLVFVRCEVYVNRSNLIRSRGMPWHGACLWVTARSAPG